MTDTATLRSLLERCKAATGPDRELDGYIALGVGGYVLEKRGRDQKTWFYPLDGKSGRKQLNHWSYAGLARYTASIDACVALVEKVLPGWHYSCGGESRHKGWAEVVSQRFLNGEVNGEHASSFSPTIPLAILTALITALIDQAERAER